MSQYFIYKGEKYFNNTVVKIYDNKQSNFKFAPCLVFDEIKNDKYYCFHSLYYCLECYNILEDDLEAYIEKIVIPVTIDNIESKSKHKIKEKDVDNIIIAWGWYIAIIIFSMALSSIIVKCALGGLASYVFFTWKAKKMRGE